MEEVCVQTGVEKVEGVGEIEEVDGVRWEKKVYLEEI